MLRGKGFVGLRPLPFGLPPLRMRGMTNVRLIRRCAQNLTKSKEYRAIDIYICFGGTGFVGLRPLPFGLPPLHMRGMTNVSLIGRCAQNLTKSKRQTCN